MLKKNIATRFFLLAFLLIGMTASSLAYDTDFQEEDGDLSEWTDNGNNDFDFFSASQVEVNQGSWSIDADAGSNKRIFLNVNQGQPSEITFYMKEDTFGNNPMYSVIDAGTEIIRYDATEEFSPSDGEWFRVEFRNIDWGANNYDLWVDGTTRATGKSFDASGDSFDQIRLYTNSDEFYVDSTVALNKPPTIQEFFVSPSQPVVNTSVNVTSTIGDSDSTLDNVTFEAFFDGNQVKEETIDYDTSQGVFTNETLVDWLTVNNTGDYTFYATASDTDGATQTNSTVVTVVEPARIENFTDVQPIDGAQFIDGDTVNYSFGFEGNSGELYITRNSSQLESYYFRDTFEDANIDGWTSFDLQSLSLNTNNPINGTYDLEASSIQSGGNTDITVDKNDDYNISFKIKITEKSSDPDDDIEVFLKDSTGGPFAVIGFDPATNNIYSKGYDGSTTTEYDTGVDYSVGTSQKITVKRTYSDSDSDGEGNEIEILVDGVSQGNFESYYGGAPFEKFELELDSDTGSTLTAQVDDISYFLQDNEPQNQTGDKIVKYFNHSLGSANYSTVESDVDLGTYKWNIRYFNESNAINNNTDLLDQYEDISNNRTYTVNENPNAVNISLETPRNREGAQFNFSRYLNNVIVLESANSAELPSPASSSYTFTGGDSQEHTIEFLETINETSAKVRVDGGENVTLTEYEDEEFFFSINPDVFRVHGVRRTGGTTDGDLVLSYMNASESTSVAYLPTVSSSLSGTYKLQRRSAGDLSWNTIDTASPSQGFTTWYNYTESLTEGYYEARVRFEGDSGSRYETEPHLFASGNVADLRLVKPENGKVVKKGFSNDPYDFSENVTISTADNGGTIYINYKLPNGTVFTAPGKSVIANSYNDFTAFLNTEFNQSGTFEVWANFTGDNIRTPSNFVDVTTYAAESENEENYDNSTQGVNPNNESENVTLAQPVYWYWDAIEPVYPNTRFAIPGGNSEVDFEFEFGTNSTLNRKFVLEQPNGSVVYTKNISSFNNNITVFENDLSNDWTTGNYTWYGRLSNSTFQTSTSKTEFAMNTLDTKITINDPQNGQFVVPEVRFNVGLESLNEGGKVELIVNNQPIKNVTVADPGSIKDVLVTINYDFGLDQGDKNWTAKFYGDTGTVLTTNDVNTFTVQGNSLEAYIYAPLNSFTLEAFGIESEYLINLLAIMVLMVLFGLISKTLFQSPVYGFAFALIIIDIIGFYGYLHPYVTGVAIGITLLWVGKKVIR